MNNNNQRKNSWRITTPGEHVLKRDTCAAT